LIIINIDTLAFASSILESNSPDGWLEGDP
jgi:hypothetical protein